MNTIKKLNLVAVFLLPAALLLFAGNTHSWEITGDKSGVTSMSLSNPKTHLQNQASVVLFLEQQPVPGRGTVRYHNGVTRELTNGEVTFYWGHFKGATALWKHLESLGKVTAVLAQNRTIPDKSYGALTRVLTTGNRELFGILQKLPGNPQGFALSIEGACCGPVPFDIAAVSEMQQIK